MQKIEGEGLQQSNTTRGEVDAEVIEAYARAIQETGEFYNFTRTLEAYKKALTGKTRLILATDSQLLQLFNALPDLPSDSQPAGRRTDPETGQSEPASP